MSIRRDVGGDGLAMRRGSVFDIRKTKEEYKMEVTKEWRWVVLAMMILIRGMHRCNGCLDKERGALLQLKSWFNATSLSSWGIDSECCDWSGVVCSPTTRRVVKLDLRDFINANYKDQYLNVSLFLPFQELQSLHLAQNQLVGCINNEGFERLSGLENLELLDLRDNKFGSNIFSSLAALSSLKTLYLGNNNLKETVFVEDLDALINLQVLDLSGNQIINFEGSKDVRGPRNLTVLFLNHMTIQGRSTLLESLQALPYLKALYLKFCNFKGTIIGQGSYELRNVQELYLDYSSLDELSLQSFGAMSSLKLFSLKMSDGFFPFQGWPSFRKLEKLYLDYSTLDGSFLQTIGTISSLETLSLEYCYINGTISSLCPLNNLHELYLRVNRLSGSLPWCLANLTSLQKIDLSNNQFTGNINPLTNLTSLQFVDLSYNHFQIPISLRPFFNHSKLIEFYGEYNKVYLDSDNQHLIPKFELKVLSLSSSGNVGKFPNFIRYQHSLEYVSLSNLQLMGSFPFWLLENNTKLITLFLANNSFSGPIQLPIHSHMNLRSLDISKNYFDGNILPEFVTYLARLKYLAMSRNDFSGKIPSTFGNMSSLKWLDLSSNGLSGHVPSTFGNMSSLEQLDLSDNELFGCYPSSGNMRSLELLDLTNNGLSRIIFPGNFNLRKLIELHVGSNQLTGNIPNGLSNASMLTVLDINHNHLHGKIPEWMRNMQALEILDLSKNNISGNLPSTFNNPHLEQLYLSRNKLRGSLDNIMWNSTRLTTFDLSFNLMTGSIPAWINRLSWLGVLLLSYNNLQGEISIHLCELNEISLIDLSHNNLSGPIPPCLKCRSQSSGIPTNVSIMPIGLQPIQFTTKSNSYSYQEKILQYFSGIDLSCNNFLGQIPFEIGFLSTIKVLNLSHNSLIGHIPPTLSNLNEIESLDVSHNNLQGKIPHELTSLKRLSIFNVSYNNLSGKTPERVAQFATFDESSYRENPFLYGCPLPQNCSETMQPPSISTTSKDNEESNNNFIDMDVYYISFGISYVVAMLGVILVLYINPYWRRLWFYYAQLVTGKCYYFIVDNLLSKFMFYRLCR